MDTSTIVFWNLQRLFAPDGSPIEAALTGSDATASTAHEQVQQKIETIAAVLDRIAERAAPPLVAGFVEIESVALTAAIAEAVTSTPLAAVDLLSDDDTGFALDGLNVSMLVRTDRVAAVRRLRSHVIDRTFNTRDVLECDVDLHDGTTLSVLVNHWPSRLVGEAAGLRVAAAHYVNRLVADKTRYGLAEMWDPEEGRIDLPNKPERQARADRPVVVMGDFNDEVFNESIEILGSTNDRDAVRSDLDVRGRTRKSKFRSYMSSEPRLYNPFWDVVGRSGSYYRTPRWRIYDQIMVTRGLLGARSDLRYVEDSATVFDESEVELTDGTRWSLTNRNGKPISFDPRRRRGCSDHFPVYIEIEHP